MALAKAESQRARYRWGKNIALTTAEVDAGYVLICQFHTTNPTVAVAVAVDYNS
ncbi:hypothetical protein M2405_006168 [Rhodococcus erythropolis]|nr:hypothetical protein [Rhodococcus erythropolis]MCS4257841.1 hypothetical protein [Rhodococcus erythropolis]MCW2425145.1 hypothetical protein [Rhodococcus erythropolis]